MEKFKVWLILFLVTLVFYGSSITYGFSQDDFFHILISRAATVRDFIGFFTPHPDAWLFYRPVSTQVWYWIFETLFGWRQAPIPMHLAAILIHTSNAYLVKLLAEKVFNLSYRSAVLAGIVYLVSSVHFLSLFYLGATQQLLATFFGLLAIHANLDNKRAHEVIFFVLSLGSKEIAIRLVPLIVLIHIMRGKSVPHALKASLTFIGVALVYLGIRVGTGIATAPEYAFDLDPLTTAATVMWYALLSLGAPEHILTFGLSGGRIDFMRFLGEMSTAAWINLSALLGVVGALLLTKWTRLHLVYGIFWVAALSPVLFLPTHRYAHYLDLSLIPMLAVLLAKTKPRWLKAIGVIAFVVAATSAQYIDKMTHWTIQREKIADTAIGSLEGGEACRGVDTLAISGTLEDRREVQYALALANGPRVICGNTSLEVIYEEEGMRDLDVYTLDAHELVRP